MLDVLMMEEDASSDSGGPAVAVAADGGEAVASPAMPPCKLANVNLYRLTLMQRSSSC